MALGQGILGVDVQIGDSDGVSASRRRRIREFHIFSVAAVFASPRLRTIDLAVCSLILCAAGLEASDVFPVGHDDVVSSFLEDPPSFGPEAIQQVFSFVSLLHPLLDYIIRI